MNNDEEGANNSSGSKRKDTSSHSKAARSRKSNKKLRSHLQKTRDRLDTTRLELEMTKTALKKAKDKINDEEWKKTNAVPADQGIDPKQVDTLRKKLRELEDENTKLRAEAPDDDGNDDNEDIDWNLTLGNWSKNQLREGVVYLDQENRVQSALVKDLEEHIAKLEKALKKSGLSHKDEMSEGMRMNIREVLKEVSFGKVRLIFGNNENHMNDFFKIVYDDYKKTKNCLPQEEMKDWPLKEFQRVYGKDIWGFFKTQRQGHQTKLYSACVSESICRAMCPPFHKSNLH